MKDSEIEWFRPLWLRVVVTVLVAAWFAWETFWNRDQLWMIITGAALAYAVWNLFIAYKPPPPKKTGAPAAGGPAGGEAAVSGTTADESAADEPAGDKHRGTGSDGEPKA